MKQKLLYFSIFLVLTSGYSQDFGPIETMTNQFWDEESNSWFTYTSMTNTYTNGLVSSQLTETLDFTTSNLVESGKSNYSYGTDNLADEVIQYTWNSSTNSWDSYLKDVISYTDDNKEDIVTTSIWANGEWVNSSKTLFSYSNGLNSQQIEQEWINDSWANTLRTDYAYDNEEIIQEDTYEWNIITSSWDPIRKATTLTDGTAITILYEVYKDGQWVNEGRETQTLDANRYVVETVEEYWDQFTNSWILQTRTMLTNNDQGWVEEMTTEFWEDGTWYMSARLLFTYYTGALSIAQSEEFAALRIYPNPAKEYFTISNNEVIKNGTIKVYNITGQEVLSQTISGSSLNRVNISQLSSGMYTVQINDGKTRKVKKLVKQ